MAHRLHPLFPSGGYLGNKTSRVSRTLRASYRPEGIEPSKWPARAEGELHGALHLGSISYLARNPESQTTEKLEHAISAQSSS